MSDDTTLSATPAQLKEFLLAVALVRTVFIWGAPGIGKSALVEEFAAAIGLPCVSLLGSQLAPEDLLGVPQIIDGKSRFCPPEMIARDEPYVLFLDELNACSHDVQKSFYSLIHDRRIGNYKLHKDSIVIGAGNRVQDAAIVKPMSSALINRLMHIHMRASSRDWLAWASRSKVHPWVMGYIRARPDHLWQEPSKDERPFSTPRSWHMLSDALYTAGNNVEPELLDFIAHSSLSPEHAVQFRTFVDKIVNRFGIQQLLDGRTSWPRQAEDRDLLYFLAHVLRQHLRQNLPAQPEDLNDASKYLVHRAKVLIQQLAQIEGEMAQMVFLDADQTSSSKNSSHSHSDDKLPDWFAIELVRLWS